MEYLQYLNSFNQTALTSFRFKPCYKWNTFNTGPYFYGTKDQYMRVLNLVISGIPSIQEEVERLNSLEFEF